LKDDIDQLNAFVKVTQDQLNACGETTHDLLANLFKGYLSCKDPTFCRYIEKKQEDYDDGTTFTVDSLMNLASNKFKTLVESGKWMAPTDEQSKILALEAKLGKMGKSSNQKASSNSGSKSTNSVSKDGKGGKSQKKNKGKKDIPAWMTKWPGKAFVDANQTKVVDGKTHWWCKKHKRFCQHQTSDCRKPPGSSSGQSGPPRNSSGSSNSSQNTSHTSHPSAPSIRVSTATLMDE
jgi:hypothetical protein